MCVNLGSYPGILELLHYPVRILVMPISNRDYDCLYRGDPDREGARRMLDQDTDKALQRAINDAMHDDWRFFLACFVYIDAVEAARQLEVELDRTHPPGAPEQILH